MNYGELRTYFMSILNRTDCTEAQADIFISLGIRRAERLFRTPMQKHNLAYVVPVDWVGYISVPTDYLGMHYMKVNRIPLTRVSDALVGIPETGTPRSYFINNARFYFQPGLSVGDVVDLCCYTEFQEPGNSSSIPNLAVILPDVIIYAGLVFASDHYMDVRKPDFEMTFKTLGMEAQMMADVDELSGMVVTNPYAGIV